MATLEWGDTFDHDSKAIARKMVKTRIVECTTPRDACTLQDVSEDITPAVVREILARAA